MLALHPPDARDYIAPTGPANVLAVFWGFTLSKIDQAKIAKYTDVALRLANNFSDKDSFHYANGPEIGPLLERIQNSGASHHGGPVQGEGMFLAPFTQCLENVDIACVGVPLDKSANYDLSGPRQGPRALRFASAGQGEIHEPSGLNVFDASSIIDWGDVEFNIAEQSQAKHIERIAKIYRNFARRGISTFSVGGEHVSTYGVLKGLTLDGERPVALIHLDAHHNASGDQHGPRLNDSGFLRLATVKGLIDPEKSTQAGLRGRGLTGLEFSRETGMNIVTARNLQARGAGNVAEQIRKMVGNMPCYLTMDTSVLDCGVMPGTRLPVPFGLSAREVREFLDGLCGVNLIGADIMELSPQYDSACVSSALASGIGFEMLGLLSKASVSRKQYEAASQVDICPLGSRQLA